MNDRNFFNFSVKETQSSLNDKPPQMQAGIPALVDLVQKAGAGKGKKADLTKIIIAWTEDPKSERGQKLFEFLTVHFPAIKTKTLNTVWGLAAFGPKAAFSAMIYLVTQYEELSADQLTQLIDLCEHWIKKGSLMPGELFCHKCNGSCRPFNAKADEFCQTMGKQAAFLAKLSKVIAKGGDSDAARAFFALSMELELYQCASYVRNIFDHLDNETAGKFFAQSAGRVRYLVFQKTSDALRETLKEVMRSKDQVWNAHQEMYTPSNIYEMVYDMCGTCSPSELSWVHSIFGLEPDNFNMRELISAVRCWNTPLIGAMVKAGYPKFIAKTDLLIDVLQPLGKIAPSFESLTLLNHILQAVEKAHNPPRLTPYDAVELMTMPLFALDRSAIAKVTDWEQKYNASNHPSSLLYDIGTVFFLLHQGILEKWAKAKGKEKISLEKIEWQEPNPECIKLLRRFGFTA